MQKGVFYNPLCNLLIMRRLQSRFLMIMSWFANNSTLQFVRVFQKPLPDPLRRERGIISGIPRCVWEEGVRKKQASPRPSPKGEGEQLARFPRYVWEDIKRCLRVLIDWFWDWKVNKLLAQNHEFPNWEIDGLCVINYEFTNWEIGGLRAINYEFPNWEIDGLCVINHEFPNWEIGGLRAINYEFTN